MGLDPSVGEHTGDLYAALVLAAAILAAPAATAVDVTVGSLAG